MFTRVRALIGDETLEKIQQKKILLVGVGGVGGYTLEALVRSGFKNITIIDGDVIQESNLNRQIITTRDNIGYKKVLEAKKRVLLINEDVNIEVRDIFLRQDNFLEVVRNEYDYIIDACDTVSIKVMLIRMCTKLSKKLISCTGTANKVSPQLLEVVSLGNTTGDPLARVLRNILKKERKCLKTMVVSSKEVPLKQKELGTLCPVPMAAGSLLVSYILNDIL